MFTGYGRDVVGVLGSVVRVGRVDMVAVVEF